MALQALYAALWLKRTIWARLVWALYDKREMAKAIERSFQQHKFPPPEMWVGSISDYLDQILSDDETETEIKIKAALEQGDWQALDGFRMSPK